ncbi:uncharacterized protein BDR25DRAFT_210550 [Lindgomyces ingoldianus]|uniref:Uncharacterized protein n=1 Tax=Lindgomyces ingoldianus TaxID=673940 RepID=A0ACB6RC70_9PLEO|nr:uncharacterized protein BDR25DRAFT_210550 [Lindgomyces ingoldianus]KAF2476363.1 hypothetical protein BDR25DRAFT_210550 [Lindgomyces ingoldianus]
MYDFIDKLTEEEGEGFGPESELSLVWGRIDHQGGFSSRPDRHRVPIFSNLLKRKTTPKECIVCAEEKFEVACGPWEEWRHVHARFSGSWTWTVLEYPIPQNQRCSHSLDVCRICVAKHIAVCLDSGNFERISCPQCDRIFTYDEIKGLCNEEDFERYDKIILRTILSKDPNFRWCLSPACERGQIYENIDPTLPCVQCSTCEFKMCFHHALPWHVGLTCSEVDSDPKYAETQTLIQESTKACPQCRIRIEKGAGCFHMTCSSCHHEFCWECLVSWKAVTTSKNNHAEGCYFRSGTWSPTQITGTNLNTALQEYNV